MKPEKFFSKEEKQKITQSIKEAETNTSGEIRVHLESSVEGNALDRASYLFEKLQMHRTKLRNGVLFYLAIDSHQFAILGDAGINKLVPENFWDEIKESMADRFQEGEFTEGLCNGILMTGEQLKKHFPYQKDDINELSDEISFGQKQEN